MDQQETLTDRYFKLSRQLEPRFLTEHVPMVWKAAKGVTVWDIEGKEYLDCTSGIFVAAIGHSHPKICEGGFCAGGATSYLLRPAE